ncbi:NAD-dependent epimerase/dehydratase family protein [Paradevosia shaoguanensis]|uniref:NAD-dependent epimerase/dehydratase family protein n=1 Tax=Paradevosia shaoguanensis TaxID=1335043 RepID=UPI003C73D964
MQRSKKRLLVTGAPGIIGSNLARRLLEAGYDVRTTALTAWPEAPCQHTITDLRDFGQAVEVINGSDAVLHLAAVHKSGVHTDAETFNSNVVSSFNVIHAAAMLGVGKVVYASSTHTAGAWWTPDFHPADLPIREAEQYRLPDTYGLSKLAIEQVVRNQRAWNGTQLVGLRYGYTHEAEDYAQIARIWENPTARAANLWNYVDGRDVFAATRLALESDAANGEVFNVTAADTIMNVPSRDLVAQLFPNARLANDLPEFGTLYSIQSAREKLGYEPQHSWRHHV